MYIYIYIASIVNKAQLFAFYSIKLKFLANNLVFYILQTQNFWQQKIYLDY